MTKAEYVRDFPHQFDFCWCCKGDFDTCKCDFMEVSNKCRYCGKCQIHCFCLRQTGQMSTLVNRVNAGELTAEQAADIVKGWLENA